MKIKVNDKLVELETLLRRSRIPWAAIQKHGGKKLIRSIRDDAGRHGDRELYQKASAALKR